MRTIAAAMASSDVPDIRLMMRRVSFFETAMSRSTRFMTGLPSPRHGRGRREAAAAWPPHSTRLHAAAYFRATAMPSRPWRSRLEYLPQRFRREQRARFVRADALLRHHRGESHAAVRVAHRLHGHGARDA